MVAALLGSDFLNPRVGVGPSALAKVPIRLSPLPLGRFSYASKTTALTPNGIRELSFLASVL